MKRCDSRAYRWEHCQSGKLEESWELPESRELSSVAGVSVRGDHKSESGRSFGEFLYPNSLSPRIPSKHNPARIGTSLIWISAPTTVPHVSLHNDEGLTGGNDVELPGHPTGDPVMNPLLPQDANRDRVAF